MELYLGRDSEVLVIESMMYEEAPKEIKKFTEGGNYEMNISRDTGWEGELYGLETEQYCCRFC